MTVPNAGPLRPDPAAPDGMDLRRGNPALVYRDEPISGDMEAASTRATTVSQRFGGTRYALTRSDGISPVWRLTDGGDLDASQ